MAEAASMIRDASVPAGGGRHAPWILCLTLTATFIVGYMDRQVLNLLVQPIKTTLHLTDIHFGLLLGVGFSATYTLMSPVFGRLADTSSRRNVLIGCLVAWTVATTACGLAGSFNAMLLARAVVGAAEAALMPAAYSMLSDAFDGKRLLRALSIYHLGPPLGNGLGLLMGGAIIATVTQWQAGEGGLTAFYPWQLTIVVISAFGIAPLIALCLLREPARRQRPSEPKVTSLAEALDLLRRERRFYGLFLGGLMFAVVPVYAFPAWLPALAVRRFGVSVATVGFEYGLVILASGIVGALSAPWVATVVERAGVREAPLRILVAANLVVLAGCVALPFVPSYHALLILVGLVSYAYTMPTTLAGAALLNVSPNMIRGFVSSLWIVTATISGLVLAPLAVATMTDIVFVDERRIGDSLAIVVGLSALAAAILIARAVPHYRALLARAA